MWARLAAAWGLFLPGAWWWVQHGGGALSTVSAVVVYIALLAALFGWRFLGGAWRRIELVEEAPLD
jgi:Na+-driven multidrug efflux pump